MKQLLLFWWLDSSVTSIAITVTAINNQLKISTGTLSEKLLELGLIRGTDSVLILCVKCISWWPTNDNELWLPSILLLDLMEMFFVSPANVCICLDFRKSHGLHKDNLHIRLPGWQRQIKIYAHSSPKDRKHWCRPKFQQNLFGTNSSKCDLRKQNNIGCKIISKYLIFILLLRICLNG